MNGCLQVTSNCVADDIADDAAASEEFATLLLDRVAYRVRKSLYITVTNVTLKKYAENKGN